MPLRPGTYSGSGRFEPRRLAPDPRSIRRHEDPPLLTGAGRYVADIGFRDQLSMVVIRSPVAHARIIDIDTSAAGSMSGVAAVYSAHDLLTDLGKVPKIPPRVSFDERTVPYLQPVLADGVVRYVGEPIAVILASDPYVAEDAAELVSVDFDDLPVSVDPRATIQAPAIFPHGNEIATLLGGYGDALAATASAEVVVTADISVGRHSGVPMETRGILVEYDTDQDRCVVHGATKVPHWNRGALSKLLGIDPSRITLRESLVGGGFGVRGELYPEDVLAVWCAFRHGRSIRWIEDRREHLMAANHSREQFHRATIAGDEAGNIAAITTEFWVDLGGYVRTHGIRVPDLTLSMIPGPYAIPHYSATAHCVVTNRTPTGTYRAPGRFESSFVRERLIDMYAAAAHLDPIAVRRQNLIQPAQMPFHRPLKSTGEAMVFTDGAYGSMLDRVAGLIDWEGLARRRAAGEWVGAGVAAFLEKSGLGPWETGSVSVDPGGAIRVRSGGSSVGQGIRTVLAQIVADRLQVDPAQVTVEPLDTDVTTAGIGSYASRTTVTAGSAVLKAVESVLKQARERTAGYLEIHPDDLEYAKGSFSVRGDPAVSLELGYIAGIAPPGSPAEPSGLHADEVFDVERVVYPYGAHGAVVAIDPETGYVRVEHLILGYDVGRAINPMLVEGQMHGGAIQALGGTLLESFEYDAMGNPLAASFMDYLLPTLSEVPHITTVLTEDSPTDTNPLGIKGAGEGGVTGVAAAIAGAIDQALGHPGAVRSVPVTSEFIRSVAAQSGTEQTR